MERDAPAHSTGYLLWQAVNQWQRRQKRVLRPFGLTPVQYLLLAGLSDLQEGDGAPVTQAELARHCRTDPMMTSQVLRALEGQGFVVRRTHDGDARAIALRITDEARALVRRAVDTVAESDEAFFAALGADIPAFGDALSLLIGEKPRRRVPAGRG